MPSPRIKLHQQVAVYHCITRTIQGRRLLDEFGKEVFRKQMWQQAEFCGVEILTYAILSNHVHVLAQVSHFGV